MDRGRHEPVGGWSQMHLVPDTVKTVSGQQEKAFRCVDQKEPDQNRHFSGCSRTSLSFDIMTWSPFPPSTPASPTFSHPGSTFFPSQFSASMFTA